MNKKAFIASWPVDFWAYILFVVIIVVFAILFKLQDAAMQNQLTGIQSITDGNYLAQLYLRTPLAADNLPEDFTIADFIIYYDYNVSVEKSLNTPIDLLWSGVKFIYGIQDVNYRTIVALTDDFIKDNMDKKACYLFGITGNDFEYSVIGPECSSIAISISSLFGVHNSIPEESYSTYIPPLDPTKQNIKIVVVQDLKSLLSTYAADTFSTVSDVAKVIQIISCQQNPLSAGCRELVNELQS